MTYKDAVKKYIFKFLDDSKLEIRDKDDYVRFKDKNRKELFLYNKNTHSLFFDGTVFYEQLTLLDLQDDLPIFKNIIFDYFEERYPELRIDSVI